MSITVILVDADHRSRDYIHSVLNCYTEFRVIGECDDGDNAIKMIKSLRPQLMFMDVDIPKLDGISLIRALQQIAPLTVITTTDANHAVDAFEVHAADYILKPFNKVRLIKALDWVKIRLGYAESTVDESAHHQDEIRDDAPNQGPMSRIMIKSNGRVSLVKISDIDWIEASGNYLRLHVGEKVHMIRETMSSMEQKLHSDQFMRIHRSTIVNIDRIKEMQPWFHGEYEVHLYNGKRLSMSRGYKDKLNEFVKK
jgi:two-component system LytT family response regulator